MRGRFYIVCVRKDIFASVNGYSVALFVAMHILNSLWDSLSAIKEHSEYALCLKDFMLPVADPLVYEHVEVAQKRAIQLQGRTAPPHNKRRLSESSEEPTEHDKDANDWPAVSKAYYESIGLEYKPEADNIFRSHFTDCAW